mmetsp:Transcript_143311/g.267108  ORF Transcript_143311/g.267108 Transcript_143311/m.267108 type:complete len:200 (+) Transcript_143311:114-713(+)
MYRPPRRCMWIFWRISQKSAPLASQISAKPEGLPCGFCISVHGRSLASSYLLTPASSMKCKRSASVSEKGRPRSTMEFALAGVCTAQASRPLPLLSRRLALGLLLFQGPSNESSWLRFLFQDELSFSCPPSPKSSSLALPLVPLSFTSEQLGHPASTCKLLSLRYFSGCATGDCTDSTYCKLAVLERRVTGSIVMQWSA